MSNLILGTRNWKENMNDLTVKVSELNTTSARKFADYILQNELGSGRGDTLEATLLRIQCKWGLSPSLMDRFTSKSKHINGMLLENYAALALAYTTIKSKSGPEYAETRELYQMDSRVGRFADFVAGWDKKEG